MSETPAADTPGNETDPVAHLLTLGEPEELRVQDWPNYPTAFGLTEAYVPALIAMAGDLALHAIEDNKAPRAWGPTHAWRALGQLGAVSAIAPLLKLLAADYEDGTVPGIDDDLPDVLALIGPSAIPDLEAFIANPDVPPDCTGIAMVALTKIVERHPDERDARVAYLTGLLTAKPEPAFEIQSWAISSLIDLKAPESIDAIRAAFARDAIDITYCGDLEDVEIDLGLREKRDTPKPDYEALMEAAWNEDEDDGPTEPIRTVAKIGRNEPCPCGSGKKYKKCCLVAA